MNVFVVLGADTQAWDAIGGLTIDGRKNGISFAFATAADAPDAATKAAGATGTVTNDFSYRVETEEFKTDFKAFASLDVSIQDPAVVPDTLLVAVSSADTTFYLDQTEAPREIRVRVLGKNISSLRWDWDYGDGTTGSTFPADPPSLVIPGHTYTQTDTYRVRITATERATGRSGTTQFGVEVRDADDFFAFVSGEHFVLDPPATGDYSARTLGGTPDFEYAWQVLPSGLAEAGDENHSLSFDQPGSFLASATVTDSANRVAKAFFPVTVIGAKPLLRHLLRYRNPNRAWMLPQASRYSAAFWWPMGRRVATESPSTGVTARSPKSRTPASTQT